MKMQVTSLKNYDESIEFNWVEKTAQLGPQISSNAAPNDKSRLFVFENYKLLKEHRLFSAAIPVALGGGGASYDDLCNIIRELGRYCGSTALSFAMHTHPVATNVYKHQKGDEQATASLKKIAENELVIAGTGANDWLTSSGKMERTEGGYYINARKHFVSGSPGAQVFITSGIYEGKDGQEVLHFAIPFSSEGITLHDNWDTIGMRSTGSNDISLENVFVPDENIVVRRPVGEWHPMWNVIIPTAMPLIMSAYVGIADAAVKLGLAAAKRKPDHLASVAGEMLNSHAVSTLALEDMIRKNNNHGFIPSNENSSDIFIRKTLASTATQKTVQLAIELVGGAAFFKGHPLERIARDIRASHFHPLPLRRQQMFSGRVACGLNPFSN